MPTPLDNMMNRTRGSQIRQAGEMSLLLNTITDKIKEELREHNSALIAEATPLWKEARWNRAVRAWTNREGLMRCKTEGGDRLIDRFWLLENFEPHGDDFDEEGMAEFLPKDVQPFKAAQINHPFCLKGTTVTEFGRPGDYLIEVQGSWFGPHYILDRHLFEAMCGDQQKDDRWDIK